LSERYKEVGHPQKPSPPRTITFFLSTDPLTPSFSAKSELVLKNRDLTPSTEGDEKDDVKLGRSDKTRINFMANRIADFYRIQQR
jgi:hypothetical protein